jgi:probable HAF family extracellular repeat protein
MLSSPNKGSFLDDSLNADLLLTDNMKSSKTPMRGWQIAALACLLSAAFGMWTLSHTVHAADAYSVTTLDYPGSISTVATSIDIAARIVGFYTDTNGTHGFVFNNGSYSAVDVPGALWTAAYGINNTGQIVGGFGASENPDGRHGFLISGGSISTIDVPGSTDTIARGVNSRGQIVGDYVGNDGLQHGFRLSGGSYTTIEVPQSSSGSANAINDAGQIVG